MIKTASLLSVIILLVTNCSWMQAKPKPTQLQVREFQTREFEVKEPKKVMKALLNVLQDEGFIVKNADVELGFLSATKETDLGYGGGIFWPAKKGEENRYKKTSVVETTANVSEYGKGCRVRVNFQEKILDNLGGTAEVNQITDGKYYQDFFIKVDKGIFLQKEKL